MSVKPFQLGTTTLAPGERKTIDLPVSALSNHTPADASRACHSR